MDQYIANQIQQETPILIKAGDQQNLKMDASPNTGTGLNF